MERYVRILSINDELIQDNCPVVFEKGALLKDNKQEKNVLQLQFRNIGYKKIKAVIVEISCYDIWNKLTSKIEYNYLDLSAGINERFGSREAIVLDDIKARNFVLSIKNVFFEEGTVFEGAGILEKVESSASLEDLGELKAQFIRDVNEINHPTRCVVKPVKIKGLWQCTCGFLNYGDNLHCGNCRISRDKLFECLDFQRLQENNAKYMEEKVKEKAEREAEEIRRKAEEDRKIEEKKIQEEQKRIRRKKLFIKMGKITAIIVCISGVICGLIWGVIIPQTKYSSGMQAIEDKEYVKAYDIFNELGYFRDSKKQAEYCAYEKAEELLSIKDYELAVEYYKRANGYEDSQEKVLEAEYEYVNAHLANDNLTTYEYLEELIDIEYKDSAKIYEQLYTLTVTVNINNKEENYYESVDEVSMYNKWHCFILIDGGKPDEEKTYNFRCVLTLPDGSSEEKWINDAKTNDIFDYLVWQKSNPMYRQTGIATFSVFDEEENLLAEKTVRLIDPWDY